ncbi:MAG: radical SAM protein, partial [Synergistaceae bacterium]|nr:radical SAM protein [Synergistaceae bacterium]
PPIEKLDDLPYISGNLQSLERGVLARSRGMSVISGRGCPYRCAFCYEGKNGHTVRRRSVAAVMSEIRSRLRNNPSVKYIFFGDDTFTLDKKRVGDFCLELRKLKEEHDFVWFADAHVGVIKRFPEMVAMMVEAGLVRMQIGIESCCQKVMDLYNKNVKKQDLFDVIDICKRAGLPQLVGNIIIGGAMETRETLAETFEAVDEMYRRGGVMMEVVSTFYTPFPMTAMTADPDRFGIIVRDWEGLSSNGDFPLVETHDLSLSDLADFRKNFFFGVTGTMNRMLDDGAVPDAEILNYYRVCKYGLHGLWDQFALSRRPLADAQYRERVDGEGLLRDYSDDRVMDAHPKRTVCLSLTPGFEGEIASIGGYVLSPLEEYILRLASGKIALRDVIDRLDASFGGNFTDRGELAQQAMESLKKMEDHGLCVMGRPLNSFHAEIAGSGGPESGRGNKVLIFRLDVSLADRLRTDDHSNASALGAFILAGWLDARGYDAYVRNCRAGDVERVVSSFDAGEIAAVGFSADNENRLLVKKLSRAAAERGLPVVIGGPESRALGEGFLRESLAYAIVVGEGEITFARLLDAMRADEDISGVPGLRFIDKTGRYVDTGPGDIVENMDDIPFPAYHKSLGEVDVSSLYIMTGRGCKYACSFCHESSHKSPPRRRSVGNVVAEARHFLSSYDELKYLMFCDDTLVSDPDWLRAFCAELKELRREFSFDWYCEADVISLAENPDMIPMMVDAGLDRLQIGIESADPEMLRVYRKNITPEMVLSVVEAAYSAGLNNMFGAILVGGPFENRGHIEKNMAYLERLLRAAPGMIEVVPSILMPYPLTDIGMHPEKYGLVITDPDGICSLSDYPVMRSAEMSEREILASYMDFVRLGVSVVGKMLDEGVISHESILRSFRSALGRRSFWKNAILHHRPQMEHFYNVLSREAARRVEDVPDEALPSWRPQRMVEMWHDVSFKRGYPTLAGEALSPFEFEILKLSTGKQTIGEIASILHEKYGAPFGETEGEFLDRVLEQMKRFSEKYQMLVVPY